MKISKLISQKRDSSRVNLYLEEDFFCSISLNTVAKFDIYVGKDIDEEKLNEILISDLQQRLFDRACLYISKSVKTEKQIKRYIQDILLKKKGIWYANLDKDLLQNISENVVKNLNKYSYIDDENYAELFISSRLKNKPRGKIVLISELISKGVSKEIAQRKVDEMVEDEYHILKRTYEKKYKDEKISLDDRKKISFLLQKGFSWDLIEELINNESEK